MPRPRPQAKPVYIGDAVYAHSDGYHTILTTRDGWGAHSAHVEEGGDLVCSRCDARNDDVTERNCQVTNRIALEPQVIANLIEWLEAQKETG